MTAAAVTVRGFGYRAAGRDRWMPRDVSFQIAPGERILILGSSGSGKSTILRGLADLLDPSGTRSGHVLVDERHPSQSRHRIGLLMQDPDAFLALDRVGDDVAFGPQNQGLPPDVVRRRTQQALDVVGLDLSFSHEVDELSGGERQRVALAGVLAMQPDLLLLDEPTSQLDPASAVLIKEAVGKAVANRESTLVLVEHRVDDWLDLIDRVFILDDAGNLTTGTVNEVIDTQAAQGTWLHPPVIPHQSRVAQRAGGGLAPAIPVIEATSASYTYSGGHPALVNVTCSVDSDQIMAITGPNGSGKSTLARALGGLIVCDEGSVRATSHLVRNGSPQLLQTDIGRWSSRDLAGRIGSVFQNPEHSFVAQTVRSEVEFGPRSIGTNAAFDSLVERLTLTHLADFNPFTLSGGEQRRLSVAAALATSPDVLILDEPTFGQDPTTWRELVQLVLEERDQGRAIVVVSHDRRFVAAVASSTVHLEQGRVVADDIGDIP